MSGDSSFEIVCPCCGATLTVDARLRKVLFSTPANPSSHDRNLDQAGELLARDAERRDSLFQKSVADEKVKSDVLDRKFEEALKKSRREPSPARPLRDIDLD